MLEAGDGKGVFGMARVLFGLMLAAVAVAFLPAIAQADGVRARRAAPHYRTTVNPYPHRTPGVILTEVATLPFYGTFGGLEDTYWATRYPGPVERRYYGYGWDPRLRF
jgi:hypothetical protein